MEYGEMANELSLLPLKLMTLILTKVPAKPVLQFKCVSKEWLDIISNPKFIKRHVSESIRANSSGTLIVYQGSTLYTLDFHNANFHPTKLYYPENISLPQPGMFRIVGSCNGLLCIKFDNQIALYNPATQAHKTIPEHNLEGGRKKNKNTNFVLIFAYDCISDDYKILRFEKEKDSDHVNMAKRILFYSLSTNSWEIIENPPWKHESVQFPGVVANNSVHWMNSSHTHIKSFDLFSRRYYEMHFPEKISPKDSPTLAVLRGRLYIVTCYLDIWKLEDSGLQESCWSWTKIFRCPSSQWHSIYKLAPGFLSSSSKNLTFACSEDERKILVTRFAGPLNFICCDLESQEATIIETPGLSLNKSANVLAWAGSLVPLSD